MLLPYEKIFSRSRGIIDDPKELSLDINDQIEINTERLHNVVGDPRVRRIFSSITFDDEIQTIDFTLNNPVDDASDSDYVVGIFTIGMTIEWLKPQVNSIRRTSLVIGTDREKKLIDNYKEMIEQLDSLKAELYKRICDRGYMYNSYINERG